jgi:uncharacterized protein
MPIEIISEEIKLKEPFLIEGFQGVGMVGTLAAQYLVQKLNAKRIGYVEAPELPSMAILVEGEVRHPIRVHASKQKNLLIIESEVPLPKLMLPELGKKIVDWAKQRGVSRIICLEGFAAARKKEPTIYGVVSDKELEKEIRDHVKILKTGIIIGLTARILLEAKFKQMPVVCLISESHSEFPDGIAAAALLKKLNEIYNLEIDVEPLIKEAKEFERKLKIVLEKARELRERERGIIYG